MTSPQLSKKTLIVWVGITLAVITVYVLAALYLLNESRSTVEASNEVDFLIERELKVRSLGSTIDAIAKEGEKLESYFMDPANTIAFLENIEGLGDSLGVEVKVVSLDEGEYKDPVSGEASKDLGAVFLSVSISGEWAKLFHYLSMIESLPFAVDVLGVEFKKLGGEENSAWTLSLNLSVIKLLNS